MFRKIVSNLSLSPSAGSQLSFYLKRLQKEGITRKLSMVFAAGLIILQIATVVSPTQASNVPSPNDIIYGGVNASNPKGDILNIYDQNHDSDNHTDFQNLFKYFGITRDEIAAATVGTLNSGDHHLLSLGRDHRFADDATIVIDGQTYYQRPLYEWGDWLTYPSVNGHRADGSIFNILVDCGNIVVTSNQVQKPLLQLSKTVLPGYPANGSEVKPGQTLGYRLFFKNAGAGIAHRTFIEDPIPTGTTLKWQGGGMPIYNVDSGDIPTIGSKLHVWWSQSQMTSGFSGWTDFTVTVNASDVDGTRICNYAYIRSDEQAISRSGPICYTVKKTAPPPPTPPPPPTTPRLVPSKTVSNLTQHITNANNTQAAAGDTLQYNLITNNTGNGKGSVTVNEDITDILAYAKVTNAGGATQGNGRLIWPVASIAAGSQLVRSFQVRITNPIPATPTTPNDPKLYDLKLDNIYGNAVEVTLPAPPAKQVETATQELPQTGAGTSSTLVLIVVAGMVYFYVRNRQLVRELKMLRVDNVTGT